jgi:hypothetical protein
MKRLILAVIAGGILALGSMGPAAAHSQTVSPPAHEDPVVTGPISNAWAQAHCHSAAPAVAAGASKGVVIFSPQAALPCPDNVTNPGEQVTGPPS